MPATGRAPHLEWTDNAEANRLIAENPLALLIGFCLDQQVPIEWAFVGPLTIRERVGTLDAASLAGMDPATFTAACQQPPAIHRFPRSMAQRIQGIAQIVAQEYGGDASRLWSESPNAQELHRRLAALPGFGALKARIVAGVLANHFQVKPEGWESVVPDFPTLAGVSTGQQRREYQAMKRAHKAALRAARTADG